MQIRSYEDNNGQKRRVAEVVAQSIEFLERKAITGDKEVDAMLDAMGKEIDEIPF